jgi:hypothetical protein
MRQNSAFGCVVRGHDSPPQLGDFLQEATRLYEGSVAPDEETVGRAAKEGWREEITNFA